MMDQFEGTFSTTVASTNEESRNVVASLEHRAVRIDSPFNWIENV